MKDLVVASGNRGKLREFQQMLEPLGFRILPQSDLGIAEADEPHATFVENALAKARHVSRVSGMPAFADDSGICVAALGGQPGVRSARYAGARPGEPREAQDERNNQKLLAELAGCSDRRAHYYCVVVLVRHALDPEPLIAEGRWRGEVIAEPRGSNGFGYDPYFFLTELSRTAAQLDPAEKNRLSHRGQALRSLVAQLRAENDGN